MEELDRGGGEADIEQALSELVRNAVVVALHFYVVVDMNAPVSSFGKLVRSGRQWQQRRQVE